jgi:hypothetical protein
VSDADRNDRAAGFLLRVTDGIAGFPRLSTCCDGSPHVCPGCGLVMTHREAAEQAACNECSA